MEGQAAPEASLRRAGEQVRVGLAPLAEHQAVANAPFEGEYLAVAQRYLEALVGVGGRRSTCSASIGPVRAL